MLARIVRLADCGIRILPMRGLALALMRFMIGQVAVIRDAIAMSNNTKKKLNRLEGVVTKIEASESYWTVTVKIDE